MEATTSSSVRTEEISSVNYSVDEVCIVIGLSRPTLYSLMSVGKAPPSFTIGRRRFFPKDKTHEWMDVEFSEQNGVEAV